MGLFSQDVYLNFSDKSYLIEKQTLPELKKEKINLIVENGYVAVVGDLGNITGRFEYKRTELLGGKKGTMDIYLLPANNEPKTISVKFFAGSYLLSINALKDAKAKFAVVGEAKIQILDYKQIAKYFDKSMTLDEIEKETSELVTKTLGNECASAVSSFVSANATEAELQASLNEVVKKVLESRKTSALLANLGMAINAKGLSLRINTLSETDEIIEQISKATTEHALDALNNDQRDREERERDKIRQHEVDVIKAHNSTVTENTENRNINSNQPVKIEQKEAPKRRFCSQCGAQVSEDAKFCSSCGAKL